MCDYTVIYVDSYKGERTDYKCPHPDWGGKNKAGKSWCIFHSDDADKDAAFFTIEFKRLYDSGVHEFPGFIFPEGFDFRDVSEEGGNLEFLKAVFFRAKFFSRVDLGGAKFTGEAATNFIESEFKGTGVNFGGACFSSDGGVNFRMSKFSGTEKTNFSRTEFSGDGNVDFTWAKFKSVDGVDFKFADFSGGGIVDFHFAEFKGKDIKFSGSQFSKDGGANFSLVHFSTRGEADFSGVRFSGKGEVNFSLAQFSGKGAVNFGVSSFSGSGEVNFSMAQFTAYGKLNFAKADFASTGGANFSKARFSARGGTDFTGVSFRGEGTADFSGAVFSGNEDVFFRKRTFLDGVTADFKEVSFENPEKVTFKDVDLSRCRLMGSDISGVNFINVSWTGRGYNSSFSLGRLKVFDELFQEKGRVVRLFERLAYNLGLWKPAQKFMELLKPKGAPKEGLIRARVRDAFFKLLTLVRAASSEREREHTRVYTLYRQLLENYEGRHRRHEVGDFYAGQMEMRRREAFERPRVRILLWFYRLFSLYGERPFFPLAWLLILILTSGFINLSLGIVPGASKEIFIGQDVPARVVSGPGNLDIAVIGVGDIYQNPELIRYNDFSWETITSIRFKEDYLKALSVGFNIFTIRGTKKTYVIEDPVFGPLSVTAQMVLALLLLILFAFAMNRKLGRGR